MNLLITGGCGFIGSNFVRYWRNKNPNDTIDIIDKLTYAGHRENVDRVKDVNLHVGDICDTKLVNNIIKGKDVVVHFAAESHVDRSIASPNDFIQTNIVGTHTLLQSALNAGVKLFHHVSTDEVFGSLLIESKAKFSELTSYNPHSPYSASKASSDHLVRAYHATYGLPITISNTSNNFGPYQDPEKLIPRFITNILSDKKVPLMGKGENVRDWIYVEDHCRAIDMIIKTALNDNKIVGETFCVGADEERTNMEITNAILDYFGKNEDWIEHIPHRLGHDMRYAIDSSKIRHGLGWKPLFTFDEWLPKTIQWYESNSDWWKSLKIN